ncbi:MAG: hypothetical protein WA005_13050 [Candidatus Binataceae bacterium]
MSALDSKEFHLLLDRDGRLIVYEEKDTAWAGLLAFSTEQWAREFANASKLEVGEIASLAADDRESIAALVREVKRRAVRFLLLDLDYRTGNCIQIEFEGESLGKSRQRQFTPRTQR